MFAVAAPTEWLVYRWRIRDEARQFSELWFQYLRQEEPQKAHQLTLPTTLRQPFDQLWDFYRNNPLCPAGARGLREKPSGANFARAGAAGAARFYDTVGQKRQLDEDYVEQLYAVTYEDRGERKSFFVLMRMTRPKKAEVRTGWRIASAEGGVLPSGWKADTTDDSQPLDAPISED